MYLKILVVVAAIAQVAGAAFLSIGTFENTQRALPVLIQPASWAFSIWGLIYTLAFVYAVYQLIPKYDNNTLRTTRVPAVVAFLGSIAWLYFAGMNSWLVWLTIPLLFMMAIALIRVVKAPESDDLAQNFFSKYTLLPYAAWTGIASWINVQALLIERLVVTTDTLNIITNLSLFLGVVGLTWYCFKKSQYNIWYAGVMLWASVAVMIVNYQRESWLFTILAAVFALATAGQYVQRKRKA